MGKTSDSLLIIFYKNPVAGRVKTRLAATLGESRALDIYLKLAAHTRSVSEATPFDKIVFYSDAIDPADEWPGEKFMKALQQGNDLGERMSNAFREAFHREYRFACIIGTDCAGLTRDIIRNAFEALEESDAVIGPAQDGGYYLLGMKRLLPHVFENKQWSTPTVFDETVRDFRSMGLSYETLPVLRDVDREDDLPEMLRV